MLGHVLQQLLILSTYLGVQTIGAPDVGIAEVMIQMPVGGQQMNGFQPIVADILANGFTLFVVVGTTVDDDALAALVAYHVAVLLQRVTLYSLNFEH